ncbi:eukaryotic translation elongation factor 1 delta b (guanine nucleotide exchange protein) isoform X2 [Conger conger]|uniref:eukaryotic translation elongation factor 1 delta b (guanine nucleotide exchange protein) isoform X2 n=1 Tax=Conger conger TaxID=82655 RepID=UPI002A5B0D7D|nr:eukaryotic translation elongation factor 1 delta b (guanine nucleotide exchange protein) isoform X2 [Conger conger]
MDRPGLERPHRPGPPDRTTEEVAEGSAAGAGLVAVGNGGGVPPEGAEGSAAGAGLVAVGNGGGVPPEGAEGSAAGAGLVAVGNGGGVPPEGAEAERGGKRRPPRRTHAGERGGAWTGMGAESVWFERGVYERAESAYQAWLASGGEGVAAGGDVGRSPAPPLPRPLECHHGDQVACRHGDQVACHHLVGSVWVNRAAFELAECRFMERAQPLPLPPATPSSLAIDRPERPRPPPAARRTPDEGYLSLTPTPATPPHRQSINGLPGLPPDLLTGVWVEKPRYDQAEACYYQGLCSPLAPPLALPVALTPPPAPPATLTPPPATPAALTPPPATPSCSGSSPGAPDVAAHPPPPPLPPPPPPSPGGHGGAGRAGPEVQEVLCLLHADSERAWLEAGAFHAAERRFYERRAMELPPPEGRPPAPSMLCPDSAMAGLDFLAQEKIWFDKFRYDDAECRFYERTNGPAQPPQDTGANTILQDIARARQNIQKSLAGGVACGAGDQSELMERMKSLELENHSLHRVVDDLRSALSKLESRVVLLEKRPTAAAPAPTAAPACVKTAPAQQPKVRAPVEDDDDDDLDLFGSDEEDEEAERIREERVKQYSEKKAKKPALIAKSSILLDVKPWDDETDMARLEECVRSVQADGLLWGSSKLVPVGYGIRKLQIQCVVEDDKVGTDMLEEEITKFEDYVQSVDVAAFNKI